MASEKCPYCDGNVIRTDTTCPNCKRSLTKPNAGTASLAVGVPSSTTLLLIFALGLGTLGVLMLSEATRGVGLICFGCLLGVWGRIFQAAAHHRDAMRRLQ